MTVDAERSRPGRFLAFAWPWLILAAAAVPAVWHVVDFPEDVDDEFPTVERPTFNPMPPPAYRLAEPGDTIDRVSIYFAAGASMLAAIGLLRARGRVALWPSATALALAGLWHAATPGPTFDGWHGLGWRIVGDPSAPTSLRWAVAGCAGAGAAIVIANLFIMRRGLGGMIRGAAGRKSRWLLVVAGVMVTARQFEVPGVEPVGYWPRWAFAWGMLAFDLALVRALIGQGLPGWRRSARWSLVGTAAWLGLTVAGVWLSWYHRPLDRLHAVVPGRIYISAMPTYLGLKVAHARHHFKTIINIFPEDTPQRSPLLPQEEQFVREHGLNYLVATAADNDSDEFLDKTLALARDPDAWPILLHCHGCMDRSPGWMGVYRYLVQGRPLDAILREIEAHRGYRPKASITLMFNRVLGSRAPARYRDDPTGQRLVECAHGVKFFAHPAELPILSHIVGAPARP